MLKKEYISESMKYDISESNYYYWHIRLQPITWVHSE